jgi:putative phage-type endonuclease
VGEVLELDTRDAWLRERRRFITASDVASILGVNPWSNPLAVYGSKVKGVELRETGPMRRGRRLEPAIADEYSELTGRPVRRPGSRPWVLHVHPDIPWLASSLDRLIADSPAYPAPAGAAGEAPLEIKTAGTTEGWECSPACQPGCIEEHAPLYYELQLQVQIACSSAAWGSFAALLGLDAEAPVIRDRRPHHAVFQAIVPRLEEFWWRVQHQEPPPVQGLPGEREAVRAIWPQDDGTTVELGLADLGAVESWERAKVAESSAKAEAELADTFLRSRVGAASFGRLPDGSFLKLEETKRAGYTVQPTTYRTLRRSWPRLRGRS